MTDQQSHQQPYAGAPGAGGPQQADQIPYGAPQQGSYGQAQPQQPSNPYGQAPQNPYGQAPQNPYGTPAGGGDYGPPPKKARRNYMLILRLVIAVVVVGIGVGGYIVKQHKKADRSADGNISKQGDLDAFQLKVGDCFKKPTDAASGFSSVKAIPCAQAHDAQVFFSFDYPNAGSTAPTDDQLKSTVEPKCSDGEKAKVDESKLPDNAYMSYVVPDSTAWGKGHHDIQCVVVNDTDFTGSAVKA